LILNNETKSSTRSVMGCESLLRARTAVGETLTTGAHRKKSDDGGGKTGDKMLNFQLFRGDGRVPPHYRFSREGKERKA